MSESTSSPSVNVHPVSPSDSLSSTSDSAPRSDPTSDEQPDLGFNELLREYSHLQPHPRFPIQIRSATSSTTPTYHAESVTGSDFRARSGRGNSRGTPSALSTLSTFTRPPTSSIQPDGSTVWAHPLIASYLPRSTPSHETYPEEGGEEEEEYSPSESASRASTALTVEIRDFHPFDDESHELDNDEFSPEPTSAIPIQVESDSQRLDSLETPNTEDDIDSLSSLSHNQIGDSSSDIIRRTVTSSSQEQSDNSIQLQSQVVPPASTFSSKSSFSFTSSDDTGMSISIADPSASSSINSRIDRTVGALTSSESTSTLMNVFLNPNSNPIPQRTVSDSPYPMNGTPSSSLSLISYQVPETPSVTDVHREDSEPEMSSDRRSLHSNSSRTISSNIPSSIVMLQPSSGSPSTASTQRAFNSRSTFSIPATASSMLNPHSVLAVSPLTNPHSLSAVSPLPNPHSLPASSPLPNPYSSVATPETDLRFPIITDRFMSTTLGNVAQVDRSRAGVVNDMDTPEQPPSEALPFEPPPRIFKAIRDDEDEPGREISNERSMHLQTLTIDSHQSPGESYRPGGRTPRYLSGRTPKGMPTVPTSSQATGNSQPTSSEINSVELEQRRSDTLGSLGEASYTQDFPSENGRLVPAGPVITSRTETITSIQSHSEPFLQLRKQGTIVDSAPSSMGFEEEHLSHPLSSSTSHSQERQAYPSPVGLHLLPSEPLRALVVPSSSPSSLLRENNSLSSQTQLAANLSHAADPEAEQLYAEATTSQTRLLPSLGYLDEALSFIASERVRLTAARSTTSSANGGADASSSVEQLSRESEGEDDGLRPQEGEDWKDAIGAEKGGESKRKRRRKRPSKQPVPPESSPAKDRNAAVGPHSAGATSSPKKRRSKSAAPPLSSSASVLSLVSSKSGTMTPGRRKDKNKGKEFLIPPPPPSSSDPRSNITDSDLDDGGRTPTNIPIAGIIRVSTLFGTNSAGVKSKRIGRREREKLKFDMEKARNHKKSGDPDSFDDPIDIGVEYGPIADNNDEGAEATENGENDSISNMSLLQPPRRLRSQKVAETSPGLITKDMPTATIGQISSQSSINFYADKIKTRDSIVNTSGKDVASEKEKEKKRKPKPTKPIAHSRSYPMLNVAAELADADPLESKESTTDDRTNKSSLVPESFGQNQGEPASSNTKQSRLLALAQSLHQLFPEQREELTRVIKKVENHQVIPRTQKAVLSPDTAGSSEQKSIPIPVPAKGKKVKKGHARTASEGAITTGSDSFEVLRVPRPMTDVEEEEEDIDPRGRLPKKKDPLIHVFVDHSNILIGLLSHLRRITPYRRRLYIAHRKPLPPVVASSTTQVDSIAAVRATSSRPFPLLPTITDHSSSGRDHPIPLPSFATLPRSLPSVSLLSSLRKLDDTHSSEDFERHIASNSDGCDGSGIEGGHGSGGNSGSGLSWQKEKKTSKHLWHAALILILERGRPITRRVVVASSPLYQPMETIERFGYDVRVFIRVPDLGDGMDREHNAEKGKTSTKRISGSESGSGGNGSGTGGSSLHRYYPKANLGTSPGKVKYREQGVDELLQLKLHQAIAASDDVPDGSTIILATGDGNMGQYSEEGFLGPIRTALRRGWKVELYAWEGGLSRAWNREFGEETEWGKGGRFRIIGMEQFASWLVEASE